MSELGTHSRQRETTILQQQQDALEEMRARKDGAYLERNQVVAALAKCFPSGIARTAIEGWSEDWHGCVYIDLPTGQVSWHFHDSHAHLFADLSPYQGSWDGHDTPEKYRRLAALGAQNPQEVSPFIKRLIEDATDRIHGEIAGEILLNTIRRRIERELSEIIERSVRV